MNELTVKSVPFNGTKLLAVQENENGKIYVAINSVLRELGFNEDQVRYRREKWIDDKVISKGVQIFSHPSVNGGNQATYCISIMKLPLALAKIEITKKMKEEMPELSDKLGKYQEDCADVLAEAFIDKKQPDFPTDTRGQIQLLAQGNVELNERMDNLEERFTSFEKSLPLLPNEADEVSNAVKKRVLEVLGGKESQAYKNRGICQKAFKDAYSQLKRNFGDIKRYKDIKREQKEQAVIIAGRYEPPLYLKELITEANAQMTMGSAL